MGYGESGGAIPMYRARPHLARLDSGGGSQWDTLVAATETMETGVVAVAFDGTGFGIAWERDHDAGGGITFARVSGDGQVIGAPVHLGDHVTVPVAVGDVELAWDGAGWGLGFGMGSSGGADFVHLGADGVPDAALLEVSEPGTTSVSGVSLVATSEGFAMAWNAIDPADKFKVYFRQIQADGSATIGGVQAAPAQDGFDPQLATDGSGFGLAWNDYLNDIQSPRILFAALDADGATVGGPLELTSGGHNFGPSIGWDGSHYGVTWYDDDQVHPLPPVSMALVTASGQAAASGVIFEATSGAPYPSVAHGGSGWGVAWHSWSPDGISFRAEK